MFRVFKLLPAVAAVLALAATSVMAQGFWDAAAKMEGKFGTGFYSSSSHAMRYDRSGPVYSVAPAPQMVQSMPAPMAAPAAPEVAQVPTERRSFSTEPSDAATAPQVIRSYSYEPSAPVYRAPMRSHGGMPTFLLPRSDPRKHG
jgi:hypothetical protein